MIRRLILVRHGETVDNARGVAQGWSDSELSETGQRQVGLLAERAARLGATSLYASTLQRARTTALAIAGKTGLEPLFLDDLREMNCGDWEGQSFELVRRSDPDFHARWSQEPQLACPGGESYHDVLLRIRAAMKEISARETNGAVPVIVSHGTAIRIFATELLGLPLGMARNFAQDNTAINVFEWRSERWVLKIWNDASHCEGSL
jgi:broad specificity phosphatase PhoE